MNTGITRSVMNTGHHAGPTRTGITRSAMSTEAACRPMLDRPRSLLAIRNRRSAIGDLRLHFGAQLFHKLGIVSMGSGIGEDGGRGAEYPRDADGIPPRLCRGRPCRDRGIDVGCNDRNGIVAVAADVEGPQLLGKIPQRRRLDLPEAPFGMVPEIRRIVRLGGNGVDVTMSRDPQDEIRIAVEGGEQLRLQRACRRKHEWAYCR